MRCSTKGTHHAIPAFSFLSLCSLIASPDVQPAMYYDCFSMSLFIYFIYLFTLLFIYLIINKIYFHYFYINLY